MHILVTAGTVLSARILCARLLQAGHAVWAFDDLNAFYDSQFKQRNIALLQAMARPFEVIHGDISDPAAV